MKPFFVFLLSLCFFLLGGIKSAFADAPSSKYTTGKHVSKQQTLDKKENLADVEEDEENLFKMVTQVLIVFSFVAYLLRIDIYLQKCLPICSHFSRTSSHKYILQRVLRI